MEQGDVTVKKLFSLLFFVYFASAQDLDDLTNLIELLKSKRNMNIPAPAEWKVDNTVYSMNMRKQKDKAWDRALSIINQAKKGEKESEDLKKQVKQFEASLEAYRMSS